jgi:molybdate-binding protein/DNA-binding XRE family transcriptional regulator
MSSATDHHTTPGATVRNRLAEIRRKRGVAAAALARQAGVSRQTVYAMEAGDYVPNTAVALRLARALDVAVEDLFRLDAGPPEAPPTAKADLLECGDRFPGTPLALCHVGNRLVAVPVSPAPLWLPPADGLLVDAARSTIRRLGDESAEARLLLAGCDPSTPVLARRLARAGVGVVAAPVNSSVALDLLRRRLVHVAGTHLSGGGAAASKPATGHAAVIVFAGWEEGLVVARGNPKRIRAVEDLARPAVKLANRERGSGSRQLLDARLRQAGIAARSVAGYADAPSSGHLPAAWRVHAGLADCCVATRCAARAFGLDFVPLAEERYDLAIRREHLQLAAVARFLDTLSEAAFRRELEGLCGYDTRDTGQRVG